MISDKVVKQETQTNESSKMGRTTVLRLVDRQAPSILRSLFYLILVCILVLAVDVMLLQYSKNSRSNQLFGYDNMGMPQRRSRPSLDSEEDSRSMRRPMRHKVKPDPRGPLPSLAVPINRAYFESSNVTCRKGYARTRLQNLYGDRFDPDIPLFVDSSFLDRPNAVNLPMPFGFRDAERTVLNILKHMPETEIPEDIPQDSCLRCVVQGNGGIASRTRLGEVIDNFDVVFRLNSAPTINHENDVGRKTTFRMAYPESAFRRPEQYDPGWTFVLMMFKPLDLVWLETIIRGRKMNSRDGFWKKIPLSVPKPTKDFRIFNPEILQDTASMMGMMGVRLCDEVAVAGFGYDPNKPGAALHYYDSLPMREIWKSWTHDIHHERGILRLLKQQGIITDLSGGIR
eukprot:XP_001184759.2 PREDICTED: CMP-N-acetylneuraminate-beta-1,4-galactoside alpha-2,3-sialyltransferase isoform X2 [Strongylocentrotus purpuratus]